MAHTSLYRKYRPSTFDDVVGQQHIERTLRNAVAEGKVAHAYLFTGPRGTGKTTTARLLAKALLCERGPTGEPDATCEECIQIAEGTHPDVYELDAASRTGVDNVREEIIGRVAFAATRGHYKVYIIDEVHMLSSAAFNALLKTLEEPPSHVVFIMCTTHPNKVPETIQSRCQRFDFRRLSIEDIADRLRFIAESEGIRASKGTFALIARHAEGGMRDAITALEQLAAYTGEEITTDDVEGMLGEVDSAQLFEAAALIARRDVAGAFRWIAALVETGTDLFEFVRELTGHVRDLFVIAAVGDASGIIDRPADEVARLQAQAAEFGGPDRLAHVLDLLGELAAEMRWSSDPRLSIEVALTRMARPRGELTLGALAERVEALEETLRSGASLPTIAPPVEMSAPAPAVPPGPAPEAVSSAAAAPAPVGTTSATSSAFGATAMAPSSDADGTSAAISSPSPSPASGPASPAEPVVTAVRPAGALDGAAVRRNWQAVLLEVKKMKPSRHQTFASVEVDIDTDGKTIVLEFPADQSFSMQLAEDAENRDLLRRAFSAVFGAVPAFRYQLGRGGVRPPEQAVAPVPDTAAAASPAAAHAAPSSAISHSSVQPEPEPDGFEAAVGMTEPTAEQHHGQGASDLERLLIDGLGATIVGEHQQPTEGEDA